MVQWKYDKQAKENEIHIIIKHKSKKIKCRITIYNVTNINVPVLHDN
jgi:hypothetical protein